MEPAYVVGLRRCVFAAGLPITVCHVSYVFCEKRLLHAKMCASKVSCQGVFGLSEESERSRGIQAWRSELRHAVFCISKVKCSVRADGSELGNPKC